MNNYTKAESSMDQSMNRSGPPEVFFRKGVLKICSKFTGERPCLSVMPMQLY